MLYHKNVYSALRTHTKNITCLIWTWSWVNRFHDVHLYECWYLWCTLSLPDYVVKVAGDVRVQSTGQVPGLTDPVVILSTETHTYI